MSPYRALMGFMFGRWQVIRIISLPGFANVSDAIANNAAISVSSGSASVSDSQIGRAAVSDI